MIDSTNPRILADNIRALRDESGSQAVDISTLQTTVIAQENAIEALQVYSTDEVNTGKKWIDNSDIYRKVFNIEHLPNNTTVSIPHGIENLGVVVYFGGVVQNITGYAGRPIPYGGSPTIRYTNTGIDIQTQSDLSGSSGIIVMEYTKAPAPSPDLTPAPDDTRSIEPEEIPEVREEDPIEEPIEEPVAEVKKTSTRKKTN